MTFGRARISFNEVVRCVRIVEGKYSELQETDPLVLKAKPIIFRPRGKILQSKTISALSMENNISKPDSITICDGWYIDIHMRLYYENTKKCVIRTSPITSINGTIVTTTNGTKYCLGSIDTLVQRKLRNGSIDYHDPLKEETLPYIINAVYDAYPTI